ncbi:uncharacterized protein LOC129599556 [Paramacrobiotus metropolitanus]|uniref:uncharacterized protein LOC129599556 n=1 Tax=Paramacrobiotus metropolitanus TaxID=2943436 RepID=UPI00244622EA|nr:uncharacterized protein LOC129599556 [Paramacrobiotus metropolitanus]
MHIYETNKRAVHTWTAVDVDVDGLQQHGHVIGLKDAVGGAQRLIVDFECPGQRAVPVEYGRIFHCAGEEGIMGNLLPVFCDYRMANKKLSPAPAGNDHADVEVLLRDHPRRPWIWYPAKLLMIVFGQITALRSNPPDFVLVEVSLSGQCCRELLPLSQVRRPATLEELQRNKLDPGFFLIRCCWVSEKYWAPLEGRTAVQLGRQLDGHVKSMVSNILRRGIEMEELRMLRMRLLALGMVEGKTVPVADLRDLFRQYLAYRWSDSLLKGNSRGKEERRKAESRENPAMMLIPEILKEIFKMLDTIARLRCRRTCHLWEAILTSLELCRDVHVRLNENDDLIGEEAWNTNFSAYACIFKHITSATRTISIRGTYSDRLAVENSAGYIGQVVQALTIRLDRLILSPTATGIDGIEHDDPFHNYQQEVLIRDKTLRAYSDDLTTTYSRIGSWCDRIIWTNYSLCMYCPARYFLKLRIPRAVFDLRNLCAVQFWNVFEKCLVDTQPLDVERITCWMDQIESQSIRNCRRIIKTLREYQSCDPRPFAQYSQQDWTLDTLDSLDIRNLNGICLYVLSCCTEESSEAPSATRENDEPLTKKIKAV